MKAKPPPPAPPTVKCQSCGRTFVDALAFEKHRVGIYRGLPGRTCRTEKDMLKVGMTTNDGGLWVTLRRPVGSFF
jgi:hypothetical protein